MATLGAVVITRPSWSIRTLIVLVGCGFAAAGIAKLAAGGDGTHPWWQRAQGVELIGVAVIVVAWHGTTVRLLAAFIGVGLIVSGLTGLVAALRVSGDGRVTSALAGLAGVGFGVAALIWPRLTLLVTGIVFGAWLVYTGLAHVVAVVEGWMRPGPAPGDPAKPPSRPRRALRLTGAATALVVSLALVAGSVWLYSGSPAIVSDAFYTPPTDVPEAPGQLIRSEPLITGVPAGAQAWRILYTTTLRDGVPAVSSGTVLAPAKLPGGPLPVISVAHGTTGIVPGCAPSLSAAPFSDGAATALRQMIVDHGWVGVISDYTGLGTDGPHAYMVGQAAARNVLDATRAARQLTPLKLDHRTVVWGHSQGGHAAIWTGIVGPQYASDLKIIGVAAFAPATDLYQLANGIKNTIFGKVVSSYIADSWAAYYPQLDMSELITRRYAYRIRRIGQACFTGGRDTLAAAAITSQMFDPIFIRTALSGTLADLLHANTPTGMVRAPLLVAQGEADQLVLPRMQRQWVATRCAGGQGIDFRAYPGLDHLALVAPSSPLTAQLLEWTVARLAGQPATNTCPAAQ
jgi:uncharacterized membrane protein HdeD (DUF308 family)